MLPPPPPPSFVRPAKQSSISSRDLPLVSGTIVSTNVTPQIQTPPNSQKVPALPMESLSVPKVSVMMNDSVQLRHVATLAARPRVRAGKISLIMSHGIAPSPREKKETYVMTAAMATFPDGS